MDKLAQKRKKIAERIAVLLESKGWTQQQLADEAGVRKSYVSAILHEKANLTLSSVVRLEEALREELLIVP
jgi:transcriptional regulator with XRE-family HTH domain